MTTIITRVYKDEAAAQGVAEALRTAGHPAGAISLIAKGQGDIEQQLASARVPAQAVAAYAKAVKGGKALVVARAEITPFGAARNARQVMDAHEPITIAGAVPEHIADGPAASNARAPSILADHRRFLSTDMDPGRKKPHRFFSDSLGFRLLSDRKPAEGTVMKGGAFMSQRFWSGPLLKKEPRKSSVMPGAPYMSQSFWPAKLVTRRD